MYQTGNNIKNIVHILTGGISAVVDFVAGKIVGLFAKRVGLTQNITAAIGGSIIAIEYSTREGNSKAQRANAWNLKNKCGQCRMKGHNKQNCPLLQGGAEANAWQQFVQACGDVAVDDVVDAINDEIDAGGALGL